MVRRACLALKGMPEMLSETWLRGLRAVTAAACALGLLLAAGPARAGGELLVFAAASTTNAVSEIGRAFEQAQGVKVVNSFAASSTLAKQIAHGAPAQVFISANQKWMDWLQSQNLVVEGSRADIARNALVLIAPASSGQGEVAVGSGLDLAGLLAGGRLAMGDPAHVPAGMYGQQSLESLGLWPRVRGRVAAAATVRSALALVERGEAPLGVVYASDAAISAKVKVVGRFPPETHRPIVYPAAVVQGQDSPQARAYLQFLGGPQAAAILGKYGFLAR